MGPDAEAVLHDINSHINIPFVLNWDAKTQEIDMVAKTVMRKTDFKSNNTKLEV
jgi:hypothetical protein